MWSSARDKAEKRKQLCRSATVSSLCTDQQKETEKMKDERQEKVKEKMKEKMKEKIKRSIDNEERQR